MRELNCERFYVIHRTGRTFYARPRALWRTQTNVGKQICNTLLRDDERISKKPINCNAARYCWFPFSLCLLFRSLFLSIYCASQSDTHSSGTIKNIMLLRIVKTLARHGMRLLPCTRRVNYISSSTLSLCKIKIKPSTQMSFSVAVPLVWITTVARAPSKILITSYIVTNGT